MFDIKEVQKEAEKEIAEEKKTAAKKAIKDKLRQIAAAEKVVKNLRDEYDVLLADIGA
jgi:hypothetical protein